MKAHAPPPLAIRAAAGRVGGEFGIGTPTFFTECSTACVFVLCGQAFEALFGDHLAGKSGNVPTSSLAGKVRL